MNQRNLTTLCYIEKGDSYLMLHRIKKKLDVSKDKWIGIGGHFEQGESPEECLLREAKEETGLTLTSYRFRGLVTFIADGWEPEYMCLYTADGYEGDMIPCSEGQLEWVKKDQIDQLNLWEGDRIFFQLIRENAPFFSLKLCYRDSVLTKACLDGRELELLDERDEQGRVTGRVRARFLAHMDGTPHATSHVWVVRPNERRGYDLLLQKRTASKDSFPGCYDISSAGHVPAGDGFEESAIRELWEELGIRATAEDLEYVGSRRVEENLSFGGRLFHNREVSRIYLYRKEVDENSLTLQRDEVEAVLWMDYEECRRRMKDGSMKHCLMDEEMDAVGKALGMGGEGSCI